MTHDNIDILVVDDDISHCTILQALLRGWGYNVALANSGRQALEQVREQLTAEAIAFAANDSELFLSLRNEIFAAADSPFDAVRDAVRYAAAVEKKRSSHF